MSSPIECALAQEIEDMTVAHAAQVAELQARIIEMQDDADSMVERFTVGIDGLIRKIEGDVKKFREVA